MQALNKLSNLNAVDGCGALNCRKIKMIFMDINMPLLNGWETTRKIREM